MNLLLKCAALTILTVLATNVVAAPNQPLRIAITTTTDNSGIMDVLIPEFEAKTNFPTLLIAVGSGKALRLLANGDVDVAITHSPLSEIRLLDEGAAINRRPIMYNDFIIVGPSSDPANIIELGSIAAVFARIQATQQIFVSRGDESGTHLREKLIWQTIGSLPQGQWYCETGQGMGRTLQITGELGGYTMSDRATWLAIKNSNPLAVLYQGDDRLANIYCVISGNPDLHPDLNQAGANALTDWLQSSDAASLIREFRLHGRQPFVPLLPTDH